MSHLHKFIREILNERKVLDIPELIDSVAVISSHDKNSITVSKEDGQEYSDEETSRMISLFDKVNPEYTFNLRSHDKKELLFHKKESIECKDIKIAYHVSHVSNKESIMQSGIMPKTNTKVGFQGRIYLAVTEEAVEGVIADLGHKRNWNEFAVYKIDLTKIKNIKSYQDLEFESFEEEKCAFVWTNNEIPPGAIIDSYIVKR